MQRQTSLMNDDDVSASSAVCSRFTTDVHQSHLTARNCHTVSTTTSLTITSLRYAGNRQNIITAGHVGNDRSTLDAISVMVMHRNRLLFSPARPYLISTTSVSFCRSCATKLIWFPICNNTQQPSPQLRPKQIPTLPFLFHSIQPSHGGRRREQRKYPARSRRV